MSAHESTSNAIARWLGVDAAWVLAVGLALVGIGLGWLARRVILSYVLPLARRTSTDMDEYVLRSTANPLALTLAFLGIVGGARALTTDPAWLLALDRLVPTGILVIWGVAVARITALALLRSAQRLPGQTKARGALLLGRFMKVLVAIVILFTILSVWGVSITPLLASAGIAGIALALAAQDTLANFFAGIAVYGDGLYEVGDYVVLDQGTEQEIRGEVRDIGLRSTRILTRDDVLIIVPNSVIANGRVVNETGQAAQYRVHVPTQVAYASSLDHVERVLLASATHPLVMEEPAPRVRVRAFRDSGIAVELLVWIRDPRDRGPLVHELLKVVHEAFRREGIVIPFPQRDVHVVEPPAVALPGPGRRAGAGARGGPGPGLGAGGEPGAGAGARAGPGPGAGGEPGAGARGGGPSNGPPGRGGDRPGC